MQLAPLIVLLLTSLTATNAWAASELPISIHAGTSLAYDGDDYHDIAMGLRVEAYGLSLTGWTLYGPSIGGGRYRLGIAQLDYAIEARSARIHIGGLLLLARAKSSLSGSSIDWTPLPALSVDFASGKWLWSIGTMQGPVSAGVLQLVGATGRRTFDGPTLRAISAEFSVPILSVPSLGVSVTHRLLGLDLRWSIHGTFAEEDLGYAGSVVLGLAVEFNESGAMRWYAKKLATSTPSPAR